MSTLKRIVTSILDVLKNYQRTVRTTIWSILIAWTYIVYVTNTYIQNDKEGLIELILYAMFADMGVLTIARAFEKVRIKKIEAESNTITTNTPTEVINETDEVEDETDNTNTTNTNKNGTVN